MKARGYVLIVLVGILGGFSCGQEDRAFLFEMVYPNYEFDLPAGLSATFPWVYELPRVESQIDFYLAQNNASEENIQEIRAVAATLRSLDRTDFDYIEEISVRICETGFEPCTMADEVFYIDRLDGRADDRIRLLPSLRNAKRHLIKPFYKLEVVFFFRYPTPFTTSTRLDMSFEAVN